MEREMAAVKIQAVKRAKTSRARARTQKELRAAEAAERKAMVSGETLMMAHVARLKAEELEEEAAVVRIQSAERSKRARLRVKEQRVLRAEEEARELEREAAALRIQTRQRGRSGVLEGKRRRDAREEETRLFESFRPVSPGAKDLRAALQEHETEDGRTPTAELSESRASSPALVRVKSEGQLALEALLKGPEDALEAFDSSEESVEAPRNIPEASVRPAEEEAVGLRLFEKMQADMAEHRREVKLSLCLSLFVSLFLSLP